jgi:hypothetical protein
MDGKFAHCCILHWGNGFQNTIPFDLTLNTPTFYTAPLSNAYRAFTTTYKAFKAAFFHCKTVLQVPGLQTPREAAELDPSKFVAVENFNLHQKKRETSLLDSKVTEDNKTVKTSNVPPDPQEVTKPAAPNGTICHVPLTFDPSMQATNVEDMWLATPNNQAELMRWHYCLGHLSFTKLKQLAHNGEIPKKLAKNTPPQVRGMPLWHNDLGWEFQFLVPISGTPIVSRIPILFLILKILVGIFFEIPMSGESENWNSDLQYLEFR